MATSPLPFFKAAPRQGIQLNAEPFRLMFPAGVLAGIVGVLLWPLFVWEVLPFYPNLAHARIMTGGFFGAMIIGFLGTAGPRMLGVRPLALWQLLSIASLWLGSVIAAALNAIAVADALACLTFVFGFACACRRFCQREDLPPPGFAMVIIGLLAGFTGALLNLGISLGLSWIPMPYVVAALGRLLFYQAFILLPILGVAPFFFPRFGSLPNPHAAFPDSRTPTPAWSKKALIAAGCGAFIIGTYVMEAFGMMGIAALLRTGFGVGYILWQVPLRFPAGKVGTLGRVVQAGTVLMVIGLLLPGILPSFRLGLLHVLFIGGFNLITLCVANWVIFGHSGIVGKAKGRLIYAWIAFGLIILALGTRISADILPYIRMTHLVYAAIAWIAGMMVWAVRVLPRVAKADLE